MLLDRHPKLTHVSVYCLYILSIHDPHHYLILPIASLCRMLVQEVETIPHLNPVQLHAELQVSRSMLHDPLDILRAHPGEIDIVQLTKC